MAINLERWINQQTKLAIMMAGEAEGRLSLLSELLKLVTEGEDEEPNMETVDSGDSERHSD